MKITDRIIAIELAIEKGEDYDELDHWKQIRYLVEAAKIIRIIKRVTRNIKKIERGKNVK